MKKGFMGQAESRQTFWPDSIAGSHMAARWGSEARLRLCEVYHGGDASFGCCFPDAAADPSSSPSPTPRSNAPCFLDVDSSSSSSSPRRRSHAHLSAGTSIRPLVNACHDDDANLFLLLLFFFREGFFFYPAFISNWIYTSIKIGKLVS